MRRLGEEGCVGGTLYVVSVKMAATAHPKRPQWGTTTRAGSSPCFQEQEQGEFQKGGHAVAFYYLHRVTR